MLIYYIFFSLSDFSLYNILLVHPCLYKWPHFIPLHGWIIFIVCKYQIPFIHSSIDALRWPEWGESPKGISYTYVYLQLIHFTVQKNLTQHCKATMCLVAQSCLTLCNPMAYSPPGSSVYGDSPGKNTGVGCHALLQRILPTQGLNLGLPHCRQILYYLNHQGSLPSDPATIFRYYKNSVVVEEETEAHWPPTPGLYDPPRSSLNPPALWLQWNALHAGSLLQGRLSEAHLGACVRS